MILQEDVCLGHTESILLISHSTVEHGRGEVSPRNRRFEGDLKGWMPWGLSPYSTNSSCLKTLH